MIRTFRSTAVGLSVIALSVCFTALAPPHAGGSAPKKLRLLILGGGLNTTHRFAHNSGILMDRLRLQQTAECTYTEDLDVLRPVRIEDFDVVMIYAWRANGHGGSIQNQAQKDGLAGFVNRGGGLIVVHVGNGCFDDWPEFARIVGGVWRSGTSTHTPFMKFPVKRTKPQHPLLAGIDDFEIHDELYQRLVLTPGVERDVLAVAEAGGVAEPMLWTRRYGRGRVVYTALGHGTESWSNRSFQSLLINALHWTTGGA